MSYEPRLQRKAADKIKAYLLDTYHDPAAYQIATEEVRRALLQLAVSPKMAVAPPGMFEDRPVHRFALDADGTRREVLVCFCFDAEDPGEKTILITDFKPAP